MPRRALNRIITRHKRSIHLGQPLTTILQRLRHIMSLFQRGSLGQQNIHLDPNPVACMIRRDAFVSVDERGKAPREKREFLLETIVDGGTGEAEYVLQTGGRPVVDDEEGEQSGAEGVQPPDFGGVADVGEDEGEGVEDDVGFAVFDLC